MKKEKKSISDQLLSSSHTFTDTMDNFTVEHSTTDGLVDTSSSDCSILNVILKNEPFYVLHYASYTYGNYSLSETLLNGKNYWKNFIYDGAIWYMSSSNLWTIGTLDHINKGLGDLYAPNHFSGNQWHFKDQEGNWKIPSDPNDIQVMCID